MSEQKTKPTTASVAAFLDGIADDQQRRDCKALSKVMRDATGEKPRMWGTSMVGFGSYHYRYDSGHEGDCFITGFAPRKRELSIHLMSGMTPLEAHLARLGKHRTGKACLYVKRLSDIDVDVLREMVQLSVSHVRRHGHEAGTP